MLSVDESITDTTHRRTSSANCAPIAPIYSLTATFRLRPPTVQLYPAQSAAVGKAHVAMESIACALQGF